MLDVRDWGKNLRYNTREYRCLPNVTPFSLVIILTRLSSFCENARCGLVVGCRRFRIAYRPEVLNYRSSVGWNQASCCYRRSCCLHHQVRRPYLTIFTTALGSAVRMSLDGTANEGLTWPCLTILCCNRLAICINRPDMLLVQFSKHLVCCNLPTRPPVGLYFIQVIEGNKLSCLWTNLHDFGHSISARQCP